MSEPKLYRLRDYDVGGFRSPHKTFEQWTDLYRETLRSVYLGTEAREPSPQPFEDWLRESVRDFLEEIPK